MTTGNEEVNRTAKGAPNAGIVKFPSGTGQVAVKFIEPCKTFQEALANTKINDENFLRNVVLLESKMERFNHVSKGGDGNKIFDNEIGSLRDLLTGMRSLNGLGMSLAVMAHTKIYYPSGAGMPAMGEKEIKAMHDINRIKRSQRNRKVEEEDED